MRTPSTQQRLFARSEANEHLLRGGEERSERASVYNERPLGRCARPPLGVAAQGGTVTVGHAKDNQSMIKKQFVRLIRT
jgi:hypothetical protein